jgi:hypothetical protein
LGPIIAPAMISPIRCGILNLFRMIGAKRIINRISEKSNTGLVRGKVSSNMLVASLVISFN